MKQQLPTSKVAANIFLIFAITATIATPLTLKPIVLVNGLSGSVLEFKHSSNSNDEVSTDSSWSRIWLDLFRDTVLRVDSLHKMSFLYDPETDSYRNMTGIEVRTHGNFGTVDGMDYLIKVDGVGFGPAAYMADFIKVFESKGYKKNVNLRAAAYDWRLPYHKLNYWKDNLDNLIEKLYKESNGTKVAILGHCQGGLFVTYYLMEKTQEWKDTFIDSFIPVATPWLGTNMALQAVASGTSEDYKVLGFDLLPLLPMRDACRTFGGIAGLLPHEEFNNGNPIVVTNTRNYTSKDMEIFLTDVGASYTLSQWKNTFDHKYTVKHPGTKIYCHMGLGHPTHLVNQWSESNWYKQPTHLEDVDGDGTVTKQSGTWCKNFANMNSNFKFDYHEWPGKEHTGIVLDKEVILDIFNYLNN